MRKKILLLVISMSVLLVAVYVYQSYLGSSFASIDQEDDAGELDIEVSTGSIGSEPIGRANRPQWMAIIDADTGRRQAVFKAKSRTERGSTQILDQFEIELYPSRGGRLHITGDRATLQITGEGENIEPRRGTLSGNIVITADIAEAENMAPDQRDDQQVVIHMEDMDFNYELQEIRSAGEVSIKGAEFALSGRGLLLHWNSAPDELRLLRLADGGRLVYSPQKRQRREQKLSSSDKTDTPSQTPEAAKPQTHSAQSIDGYMLTIEDNVKLDSARQQISNADQVEIVLALSRDGKLDKLGKPSVKPDKPAASDKENAIAPSESKTESVTKDKEPEDKTVTVTWAGAVMLRPLHKDSSEVELPAAGNYKISASGSNLKLISDDVEAKCTRTEYYSENNRIVLYGDEKSDASIRLAGGSELVSGSIDFNDSLRKVSAFGAGSLALGADDIAGYSGKSQGELDRAKISWSKTVTLDYVLAEDASGKTVRQPTDCEFSGNVILDSDVANVIADKMRVNFVRIIDTADSSEDKDAKSEQRLMAEKIVADGNVRMVRFNQNTDSEKPAAPAADSVDSDKLTITFKLDDSKAVSPDKALAEGNVKALSDGRSIKADRIELGFAKLDVKESDDNRTENNPGAKKIPHAKYRPAFMLASGNVFLSASLDHSGSDDDRAKATVDDSTAKNEQKVPLEPRVVTAAGETLRSDLLQGVHKLYGRDEKTPARLTLDQRDQILGEIVVIRFAEYQDADDKTRQKLTSASIDGSGRGVFMLDRDIDGKQLPAPRPAIVRWQKRMAYQSITDSIIFIGSVQLDSFDGLDFESDRPIRFDSQGDHLRSELMTIELADYEQIESGSAQGRNMVKTITAKGDAKLLRRWHDEDGFLRDRSQLSGPCIVLDQFSGQFIVLGEGSLLVEDYRAPQDDKKQAQNEAVSPIAKIDDNQEEDSYDSGLESPSQTLFKWGKTLTIVHEQDPDLALQLFNSDSASRVAALNDNSELPPPASWTAYMDGNVAMRHRSGSHIVRDESLNVRSDYQMPEGTVRQMDCRRMLVQFIERTEMVQEKDDKKPKEKTRADLALFEAVGDVYMVDGDFEAQGGRIVYDTQFGQALVSGDELGTATRNARVFKRGGVGGDIDTTSPLIRLKRKGGSYEVTAINPVGQGQR